MAVAFGRAGVRLLLLLGASCFDVALHRAKGSVMEEEEGKLGECWKSTTSVDFFFFFMVEPDPSHSVIL